MSWRTCRSSCPGRVQCVRYRQTRISTSFTPIFGGCSNRGCHPMIPRLARVFAHAAAIGVVLAAWEHAAEGGLLDPTFFGRPSGIARYLWGGFAVSGKLWFELGVTLAGAG